MNEIMDLSALARKRRPSGKELGILKVEDACETQRAYVQQDKAHPVIKNMGRFIVACHNCEDVDLSSYEAFYRWLMKTHSDALYNDAIARLNVNGQIEEMEYRQTGEEAAALSHYTDLTPEQLDRMPASVKRARTLEDFIDETAGGLNDRGKREANNFACIAETIAARVFYIRGFNYALDRAAELLEVPGVKWFKIDPEPLEGGVERYNAKTKVLQAAAKGAPVNAGLKTKAAKAIYRPITEKDIGTLDEQDKAEMDELISEFDGFIDTIGPPLEAYFTHPSKKKYIY